MGSTNEQLEERLDYIERELEALRAERAEQKNDPRLKRIAGSAIRDDVYAEITRLGSEYRRRQREP